MVTFFSVPKAFAGHVGMIQRNALASWTKLPGCEVVLCGRSAGVAEAARDFGAVHLPDVECNSFGTPLLSSVFAAVRNVARHPLITYINGDIILFRDFLSAARHAHERKALMVGRRTNLEVLEPLDGAAENWESLLRDKAAQQGVVAPANGIDYMTFPTESALVDLPPFAVGRPAWDNWFLGRARRLRMPILDATEVVLAIHQNHDYSHVPRSTGAWEGPEAAENRRLAGWLPHGPFLVHTIDDATHVVTSTGVRRQTGVRQRFRDAALQMQFILEPSRNGLRWVNYSRYACLRLGRGALRFASAKALRAAYWLYKSTFQSGGDETQEPSTKVIAGPHLLAGKKPSAISELSSCAE